MTTDTKAVARWELYDRVHTRHSEGPFVRFTDHEQVVGELQDEIRTANGTSHALRTTLGWLEDEFEKLTAALAASRAEVEGLKLVASHARNLAAWFTSGNSVPVDGVYTMKLSSRTVMDDARQLREALTAMGDGNGH